MGTELGDVRVGSAAERRRVVAGDRSILSRHGSSESQRQKRE